MPFEQSLSGAFASETMPQGYRYQRGALFAQKTFVQGLECANEEAQYVSSKADMDCVVEAQGEGSAKQRRKRAIVAPKYA